MSLRHALHCSFNARPDAHAGRWAVGRKIQLKAYFLGRVRSASEVRQMIHGLTVHACHKRDKQLLGVMNVFFVGNGCRAVPVSGRGTKHKSRHASAGEMDRPAVRSAVAEHVFCSGIPCERAIVSASAISLAGAMSVLSYSTSIGPAPIWRWLALP